MGDLDSGDRSAERSAGCHPRNLALRTESLRHWWLGWIAVFANTCGACKGFGFKSGREVVLARFVFQGESEGDEKYK